MTDASSGAVYCALSKLAMIHVPHPLEPSGSCVFRYAIARPDFRAACFAQRSARSHKSCLCRPPFAQNAAESIANVTLLHHEERSSNVSMLR